MIDALCSLGYSGLASVVVICLLLVAPHWKVNSHFNLLERERGRGKKGEF
jgi:hypothetical protein